MFMSLNTVFGLWHPGVLAKDADKNMFAKDKHCKAREQDLKNSCSYDF